MLRSLDRLVARNVRIGKLAASIAGLVEVAMLEVLNLISGRVTRDFKVRVFKSRLFRCRWGGRVVPLHLNIPVSTRYLPSEEIVAIIGRSSVHAIGECYCRKKHHRCDNPTHTCILLGPNAGQSLHEIPYRTSKFERVSKERVMNVLEDAHKRGLVHQTIFFPSPEYFYVICNCCTCCCEVLHEYKRFGAPAVIASAFVQHTNPDSCNDCGACITACPFDARRLDARGTLEVLGDRCLGCGVCVRRCPAGAITLHRRDTPD